MAMADAQCWKWIKIPVQNPPPDVYKLSYDKNACKIAWVGDYESNPTKVALYYFNGKDWDAAWRGTPDVGNPYWVYRQSAGSFFDDKLNTLVLFGIVQSNYPFAIGTAAFKYIPGKGFVAISDLAPFGIPPDQENLLLGYAISYDSIKQRAILACVWFNSWDQETVEFDGSTFFYIHNSHYTCPVGWAGYDSNIGNTILYGVPAYDGNPPNYETDTLEYDGSRWTEMNQPICENPSNCLNESDMAFVPEMNGLITITATASATPQGGTWLYKNHKWEKLQVENQIVTQLESSMAYDPNTDSVVLNTYIFSTPNIETWVLRKAGHCRPVSRP